MYKLLVFFTALVLTACSTQAEHKDPSYFKPETSASYIGVFVLTDTVAELRLNPLSASRVYAYSLLAGDLAYNNSPTDSAEIASASAIEYVASKLFQNKLAADNMKYYRLKFSPTPSELGIEVGKDIVRLANMDGFSELPLSLNASVESASPLGQLWEWEPTGLMKSPPFEPHWGTLSPIVSATKSCELPTPSAELLSSEAEFLLDLTDSLQVSKETELFLAGDGTPTPPGQWLRSVAQAGKNSGVSSSELSTLIAKTGVASYDVSIMLWREKFKHNIARPETMWKRLFNKDIVLARETPPHPSYPSGHSGFSAAASEILTTALGEVPVSFSLKEDMIAPEEVFTYQTPGEAVAAASDSRVDSFFHYPIDVQAGEKLGECVAKFVDSNYFELLGK